MDYTETTVKNKLTHDEKLIQEIIQIQDQKLTYEEKEEKILKLIEGNMKSVSEAENECDFSNVEYDKSTKLLKFCNPWIGFDNTVPVIKGKEKTSSDFLNAFIFLSRDAERFDLRYKFFDIKKCYPSDSKLLNLQEHQINSILQDLGKITNHMLNVKTRLEFLQGRFKLLMKNSKEFKTPLKNPLIFLLEKVYPPSITNLIFSFCRISKSLDYVKLEEIDPFQINAEDMKTIHLSFSNALFSNNSVLMKYIVCKFGMFLEYSEIFNSFREYEQKNEISICDYRIKPNRKDIKNNSFMKRIARLHKIYNVHELCEFFLSQVVNQKEKLRNVIDPTEPRGPAYILPAY